MATNTLQVIEATAETPLDLPISPHITPSATRSPVTELDTSSVSDESILDATTTTTTTPPPASRSLSMRNAPFTPPIAALTARKPSPGLAVRLQKLGLARHSKKKSTNALPVESIGRIEQEKINQLDELTRANTAKAVIERRGTTWTQRPASSAGSTLTDDSTAPPESLTKGVKTSDILQPVADMHIVGVDTEGETSVIIMEEPAMILHQDYDDMASQTCKILDNVHSNHVKPLSGIDMPLFEAESPVSDDTQHALPTDVPLTPQLPSELTSLSLATPISDYNCGFNPLGLERAGSIYTLSRVSFANQLAQLTSLQLPDAASLASKVAAIPTALNATDALTNAAEQIKQWILKASDVLDGLDADDDVEWAAAGGREGLAEVNTAITRFDDLINVYVSAIERLQEREDIADVSANQLNTVVTQVEAILEEWAQIRLTLKRGKRQVEVAMEWEEIWNTVFGDITTEMETLSRLVFEMEERRHRTMAEQITEVSINELETVVSTSPLTHPRKPAFKNSHLSVISGYPLSPDSPQYPLMSLEDSSLLGLFARMQPLRASLDFLPIRLSSFHVKAEAIFPTACTELESRQIALDESWQHLEKDAESLRRELGEDKWIMVFRGAGGQAQKMCDSVERSLHKVRTAVETGEHYNSPASMAQAMEGYETKKMHYGPAIDRVLLIIAKGVQDRLTVNGEIVRLQIDMQQKWEDLKIQLAHMDAHLDEIQRDRRGEQLRESVSSLMSNDRSTLASFKNSPGSSPASSVVMSSMETTTPTSAPRSRVGYSHLPQPARKYDAGSRSPANNSAQRRTGALSSLGFSSFMSSSGERRVSPAAFQASTSGPKRSSGAIPLANKFSTSVSAESKPRWSSVVKPKGDPLGFTFHELQLNSPSPYAKQGSTINHVKRHFLPTSTSSASIASTSSTQRAVSTPLPKKEYRMVQSILREESPSIGININDETNNMHFDDTPSRPRALSRIRANTPGPYNQHVLRPPVSSIPRTLKLQASTGDLSVHRTPVATNNSSFPSSNLAPRSVSSMALKQMSKRVSMLPTPSKLDYGSSSPESMMSRGRPSGVTSSPGFGGVLRGPGRDSPSVMHSGRKTPGIMFRNVSTDSGRDSPAAMHSGRRIASNTFRDVSSGSNASTPDSMLDRPRPKWK